MASDKLKVGIIGTGMITVSGHMPAWKNLPDDVEVGTAAQVSVNLDTTDGGNPGGAGVTITGPVIDGGFDSSLVIDGGTTGTVTITNAVGATPLQALTIKTRFLLGVSLTLAFLKAAWLN